ncbi:nitrate- and nitrite sensing domain-containing protein [Streptomyces cadmiisoli]|uniref:nitrate- and nitrite sensing domain-containing protein n=1 Tax=Streptomyces cadmiisoli TaxID=2184053 RepID=UPI00365E9179
MSRWTGARRRLGSIRLSLILLALVPGVTLTAIWGVTTIRMFSEGSELRAQTELSRSTGSLGTEAMFALQRERRLSAQWLASPRGDRNELDAQRAKSDAAVAELVRQRGPIAEAPARISTLLGAALEALNELEFTRDQVDDPTEITAAQALQRYDTMINRQIQAFQGLFQAVNGELAALAGPLFALEQAAELVSREDARLTLVWPSGRIGDRAWTDFAKLAHTRRWLVEDQLVPLLNGTLGHPAGRSLQGPHWRTLWEIEDQVLAAHPAGNGHSVRLPDAQKRWDVALSDISARNETGIRQQVEALLTRSADESRTLLLTATSLSAGGLLALLLCVAMSWRITRSLSRRLHGLRKATLSLAEERLPDVVARLERGERVDAASAITPLDHGHDELGQVAQAFNTAQRTAVLTAIELANIRSGFQKVILGIARQSQNLVNLQLGWLDALERRHTDPELLKDLYELDSIASQLRRYEENLVVVSGERPGRSWSRPVAMTDVLRGAVGEVAEYARVEVHTDEEVALAPHAVADVIHLLAELIDNATAYSPAPSPVVVRAAMVAKGLAVEIEDQGLGLSQEDYATLNAQLARPMQFDVVALAEDLRLGIFVVSQLTHRHGVSVTLRSSPYGGTTAIVLIPHDIVVGEAAEALSRETVPAPRVGTAEALTTAGAPTAGTAASGAGASAAAGSWFAATTPAPSAPGSPAPGGYTPAPSSAARTSRRDELTPLPRRVPQTSLAAELRDEAPSPAEDSAEAFTAEAAGASLAGFQRGTVQARDSAAER